MPAKGKQAPRARLQRKEPPAVGSGPAAVGIVSLVILLSVVVILGNGLTGAVTTQPDLSTPDGMFSFLQGNVGQLNQHADQIPSAFVSLFGNERIVGNITFSSGKVLTVTAITKNGRVVQFSRGTIDDPTLFAYTDEATIKSILASGSPAETVTKALNSGAITYHATSFTGSMKYGTASIGAKVASWFGFGS